jgi:hypothetical protein
MANPVRGEAACILEDGRTLTLVIDFEALAVAEDIADIGVNELLASLANNPRMKVLRAIVFGALQARHPEIGLDDVGSFLLTDDASPISEALGKAMGGAFPQASQSGPENPPKPSSGAGTASKPTGRRKG